MPKRFLILDAALVASWLMLLTGMVVWPHVCASATLGDDLTRGTVRLSLTYYWLAACCLAWKAQASEVETAWGRATRWLWTLAWATYIVHLGMAFHYYHHWSHDSSVDHVREVSGVGEGIYMSHLFTMLWTADVAFWWRRPQAYAGRAARIGRSLHAFMLFIVFNATVVYEHGPIRWAGLALVLSLAACWLLARARGRSTAVSNGRTAERGAAST